MLYSPKLDEVAFKGDECARIAIAESVTISIPIARDSSKELPKIENELEEVSEILLQDFLLGFHLGQGQHQKLRNALENRRNWEMHDNLFPEGLEGIEKSR